MKIFWYDFYFHEKLHWHGSKLFQKYFVLEFDSKSIKKCPIYLFRTTTFYNFCLVIPKCVSFLKQPQFVFAKMVTIQISFQSSSKYAWILNPQKLERESFKKSFFFW